MKNLAFIMLARYGHRFLLRATAYAPRGYKLDQPHICAIRRAWRRAEWEDFLAPHCIVCHSLASSPKCAAAANDAPGCQRVLASFSRWLDIAPSRLLNAGIELENPLVLGHFGGECYS